MKLNRRKRNLYIISAIVLLIIFLVIARKTGMIGSGNQILIAVEKSENRDIIETISASGKIQPRVEVKISPDVSGEVIEIYVVEGTAVKKGDKLAKIKPDTYQSNYEQILASLNAQKANLANSKARLAQVKAQLLNAESSFNRNKKLFEQKVISNTDFDNSKASYEVAKAEVDAAEQSVKAAEYSMISTEASLNEAKNNLNKTTLYAPMDGTVYQVNIEVGERVAGASQFSAGTEIMRIANLNEMEVKVNINENDVVKVNIGDTTNIEVDAYSNKKFTGVVTQISNSQTSLTSTDQVTNYDVRIRILYDTYKDMIDETKAYSFPFRPGMSASVDIITEKVYKVISVPIQAVTTRADTAKSLGKTDTIKKTETKETETLPEVLFVYSNEKVEMRHVKTGIQDSYFIEVLSGLKEGEEVVISPFSAITRKLKDGDKVKKVDKSKVFEKQ